MRAKLFATTCVLALLAAAPAMASEGGFEPPKPGSLEDREVTEPFRDSILGEGAPTSGAAAKAVQAARAPNDYQDQHGHTVAVEVSDSYDPAPEADQSLVDFLGTLAHGGELSDLTVVVLTTEELENLCGASALACYGSGNEEMFISGDGSEPGQPPLEFIVAHEYGHHVAANRDNSPWSAFGWGTKRWATHERVCPGVLDGDYHPGDQGQHYYSNPGEAFAEAFAEGHYPGVVPWDWDQSLKPDAGARQAILADVADPWRGRTKVENEGRLRRDGPRSEATVVDTPLDGKLTTDLSAPSDTDFDLYLTTAGGGKDLAGSAGNGSEERVKYTVCGRRSVGIEVYRYKGGGGPFTTETRRP